MDLQANKTDGKVLPLSNRRISAEEWNQLAASCMAFITAAGLTPDALDNEQFLNAFKAIAADLELVGANTNLSNLTAAGEGKFTAKANTDLGNVSANIDYVVERGGSGVNTWEIYKSGWCVQRGTFTTAGAAGSNIPVSFHKTFANTDIFITHSQYGYAEAAQANNGITIESITTTGFGFTCGVVANVTIYWEAKGFINQQQEEV